jgi:hypothetical protein
VAINLQSGGRLPYESGDKKCNDGCFVHRGCSSPIPASLSFVHLPGFGCPDDLDAVVALQADGQLRYESAFGNREYIELLPGGKLTYTDASGFEVLLSKLAGPEQGIDTLVSQLINALRGTDVREEVEQKSERYGTEYRFQNIQANASRCDVTYDEVDTDQKTGRPIIRSFHLFLSKPTAAGLYLMSDDLDVRTIHNIYRVAVSNAGQNVMLFFASQDLAERVAASINESAALCKTRRNDMAHTSAGERESKDEESAVALSTLLSREHAGDEVMTMAMLGRYSHSHSTARGTNSDSDEEFLAEGDARYCRSAKKIWQDALDAAPKALEKSDVAIRLSKKLSSQTALTCGQTETPLCLPNDDGPGHLIQPSGISSWGPAFPADCRITWQQLEQERAQRIK